ncbi:unnamed protein product, partial [marine sediment metagenome]
TIQPGATVRPGETFTKTWRLRNNGNIRWNGGYAVAFEGGTLMDGPESIRMPQAEPTMSASVSVVLTAPVLPGHYEATWRPRSPAGHAFGEAMPISFEVMETETYDMLRYLRGDGRAYDMRYTWGDGGVTRVQTQLEIDGAGERFYHVRDSKWVEYWFDQEYIYLGTSTADSRRTYTETSHKGHTGGPWIPRHMALHTFFRRNPIITLRRKDNCQLVNRFSRISWIRLEAVHANVALPGGVVLENVAELAVFDDADGQPNESPSERYLFAEAFGLVAWQGNRGHLVMTRALEPGSVPDNLRETVRCP